MNRFRVDATWSKGRRGDLGCAEYSRFFFLFLFFPGLSLLEKISLTVLFLPLPLSIFLFDLYLIYAALTHHTNIRTHIYIYTCN